MNIEMSCKLCIHFLRGCCEQAEYKMDIPDPVIVGVTESEVIQSGTTLLNIVWHIFGMRL